MKKPAWIVKKENAKKTAEALTIWLFGLHAVRDALLNPKRYKSRLILTENAAYKLQDALAQSDITPEIVNARKFSAPIDRSSVHQGAAIEVRPLQWGSVQECAMLHDTQKMTCVVLLDRVSDPHNVGAILRSAEVFGAKAVIAPQRHSAPETGALAKTASGALERQPYIRVQNLGRTMQELRKMGYYLIGLDGTADMNLSNLSIHASQPIGLVLGAEGAGLREKTKEYCDILAKIPYHRAFGSLNVSNAAAVSLYEIAQRNHHLYPTSKV